MSDMTEEEWSALTDDLLQHVRAMELTQVKHRSKLDMRGTFATLHLLHHNPDGLTPTKIARMTCVSTARVAATLNTLEEQGLVAREPDPSDRRRVIVRISPTGEEKLRAHKAQMTSEVEGVLKQLGTEDARSLVRIMAKMSQIVGASLEGDGAQGNGPTCPLPCTVPPFPPEGVDVSVKRADAHPVAATPFPAEEVAAR